MLFCYGRHAIGTVVDCPYTVQPRLRILKEFGGAASSIHVLVRGTGIAPHLPYFSYYGSQSGWASVVVSFWKPEHTQVPAFGNTGNGWNISKS